MLLGLGGVCFICSLTPYNDYVVRNTPMVGNYLPIGLLLFFTAFIMVINAPLWRYAPRHAFHGGELAVALAMTLVGCALPSVGLMRYLPGQLTGPFYLAGGNPDFLHVLNVMHLPDWVFPTFHSSAVLDRGADPIVRDFVGRAVVSPDTFAAHWWAVPWRAWLRPALTWGVFLAALYGATMCMALIFRRQWAENQRLPFPLAGVYMSLIEAPPPGRALNGLLASRAFWIACVGVFVIHGMNALHEYEPRWPEIPIRYDLRTFMTEGAWGLPQTEFWRQTVYFTIVGIFYFLRSDVAFSLWFCFVAVQIARVIDGPQSTVMGYFQGSDQATGAVIAFAAATLWVARRHLLMVVRQMFRGRGADKPDGSYLPYAVVAWGLVLCVTVLIGWLAAAGASWIGAVVIILCLLTMYLALMRAVAETGMLYAQFFTRPTRPWVIMGNALPGGAQIRTTLTSYYWSNVMTNLFLDDLRESPAVFISQAIRVQDEAVPEPRTRWQRLGLVLCLVLALGAAFVVSGASTLFVQYKYAATLDNPPEAPINSWGTMDMPKSALANTVDYLPPKAGPKVPYNRLAYVAAGAGITTVLSVLRVQWSAWPLHPVGYLLVYTWGLGQIWFSIFLGWLAQTLIVRFGGSGMLRRARFFFMGLILGEAGAAAFWLIISLARVSAGLDYRALRFLPS